MSIATIRKYLADEQHIHFIFEVSLWLKGAFALAEAVGGITAFFVTKQFLLNVMLWVTQAEFAEDPHDVIANFLLHSVQGLSIGSRHFAAIYMLSHGAVKLWLVAGLLRQRLWYYPVALGVFALFIVYQLYRYTFTHSIFLLLLTVLDLVVIGLTWHEWHYLSRRSARA